MSIGFDVRDELARSVAERAGAWRFINDFVAQWLSPLTSADGWDEDNLTAAEEKLGLPLPLTMREAYGLFGRRTDLTSNQDNLLTPADLVVDESGEVLIFRVENQSAAFWGVPISDLAMPDPPVVMRANLMDSGAEVWRGWLDRFSLASVELVLSESLFSKEVELADNRDITGDDVSVVEQRYSRLGIPEYPASQTGAGIRWFAGQDVLLREDRRQWLWVRARTPEALTEVRRSMPGEWQFGEES
ncbi:hypothetical protein [Nocardia colli]|uniref:hypothetical protein n=1 Tax=Nocardia colli TaxID=2545717 RepID=UPI0035D7DEED